VAAHEHDERDEAEDVAFLCECGDVGCEKCVPMTAAEYEELPREPPGLALSPGHDDFG
jgi:hypothetical protein